MLCLHFSSPGILLQWLTLFHKAPRFSCQTASFHVLKKGDFEVIFHFCSPKADDLGFERDAAEDLWEVNNRDEDEGSRKQQTTGQEKPLTCRNSAGTGVDDCIIGSCRGETGIFRWNKNGDERSTQQTPNEQRLRGQSGLGSSRLFTTLTRSACLRVMGQ